MRYPHLWMFLALVGCGDKAVTSASPDETTSGTTAGTTESPTTGSPMVATLLTTGTTGDTDASTGVSDATTIDPTGGPTTSCEAECAREVECGLLRPGDCEGSCDGGTGLGPACDAAYEDLNACLAMMTCEELIAFTEQNEPGPCADKVPALAEACPQCGSSASGNMDECSADIKCSGEPTYTIECDVQICTCIEDGQEVGNCPARGVCAAMFESFPDDEWPKFAAQCCGF